MKPVCVYLTQSLHDTLIPVTGSSDLFTVAPTSTPVTALTLQLSWDGTVIGDVNPQTLVFTDESPQQVLVTGTSTWSIV